MRLFALLIAFAVANALLSFAQSACDYEVQILVNGSAFEKNEFSYKIRAIRVDGAPTNITGAAQIEDSSGKIIKKYKPWDNEPVSKQKTSSRYAPNLNEGVYKLTANIQVGCNDTRYGNNADFKLIRIANQNNNSIEQQNDDEFENTIMLHSNNKNRQFAYRSSNEKAKEMIIYLLLGSSVVLNIVLIWRR